LLAVYKLFIEAFSAFVLLLRSFALTCVQIARVIAQFWLETMRTLADKLFLPLNVTRYAFTLRDYAVQLDDSFAALMRNHGMSLGKKNYRLFTFR
jgi:hypothetical protein